MPLWSVPFLFLATASALAGEAALPVFKEGPAIAYPRRALERGINAKVLLRLQIDDQGEVFSVELINGAGHGFDEAAIGAAALYHFSPARNDKGVAIDSSITWGTVFNTADISPLSIEGFVKKKGSKSRISNAVVVVEDEDGAPYRRTITDEHGGFRFAELEPGVWSLTITGPGITPSSASIEVPDDDYIDGVELSAEQAEWAEGMEDFISAHIEVTGFREALVVAHRITKEKIVTLPGSLGDPVRALQNLPGVQRAPFGSGQLLVRGGDPEDTAYFIDGVQIPLVFHFTGISTVIDAEVIKEVLFQPGIISVRYGGMLAGVVDLITDNDLPKQSTSSAAVDLFAAGATTRQRLGPHTAMTLAARRSWVDAVLQPILEGQGNGAIRVPRYWDVQFGLARRLGDNAQFDAWMLASNDKFRILGDSGEAGPAALEYETSFQKARLRLYTESNSAWRSETTYMAGPELRSVQLGESGSSIGNDIGLADSLLSDLPQEGGATESAFIHHLRHEWTKEAGPSGPFGLRVGGEYTFGKRGLNYDFVDGLQREAGVRVPALYAEPMLSFDGVKFQVGTRFQGVDIKEDSDHDRFRAATDFRGSLTIERGLGSVSFSHGSTSQLPKLQELYEDEGRFLDWERAVLTEVRGSIMLSPFTLSLTAYRRLTSKRVLGRDDAFEFDSTQVLPGLDDSPYSNIGSGRAWGLESLIQLEREPHLLWITTGFSRALRTRRDGTLLPSAADQPFNLNIIGSEELGKGWRLGARARYTTGSPMTEVVGRIYVANRGIYLPVEGPEFGTRLPDFFSLDIRFDKDFYTGRIDWNAYLEVQNATNRLNAEVPSWSDGFSRFTPITGLPILPTIGLEARW